MNKLLLSFAVVIVITACVGGTGVLALAKMHGLTEDISVHHMDGLYSVEEANKHKLDTDLAAANLTFADDAGKEKLKQNITASLASMHRALDNTRATVSSAEGIALYDDAAKRAAAWEDIVLMQTGAKPRPAAIDQMGLIEQAIAASGETRVAFERLVDFKRRSATEAQKASAAEYESMRIVMISLVLGSIVAAGLLAALIGRRLSKQLGGEPAYAAQIADRIAAGDLATRVAIREGDDSSMLHSLAGMSAKLADIVGGIRESSESILLASREIAQGNTDLSQRTEEQAASLEETASSMEELTATVRQNADNARQASELARERVGGRRRRAASVVGDVVDTMARSSRRLEAGSPTSSA